MTHACCGASLGSKVGTYLGHEMKSQFLQYRRSIIIICRPRSLLEFTIRKTEQLDGVNDSRAAFIHLTSTWEVTFLLAWSSTAEGANRVSALKKALSREASSVDPVTEV